MLCFSPLHQSAHFNPQNNLQNKEHVKDICCGLNPNNIHIEGRRHPSTIEVTLTLNVGRTRRQPSLTDTRQATQGEHF